jgi:hypothetical protein
LLLEYAYSDVASFASDNSILFTVLTSVNGD